MNHEVHLQVALVHLQLDQDYTDPPPPQSDPPPSYATDVIHLQPGQWSHWSTSSLATGRRSTVSSSRASNFDPAAPNAVVRLLTMYDSLKTLDIEYVFKKYKNKQLWEQCASRVQALFRLLICLVETLELGNCTL